MAPKPKHKAEVKEVDGSVNEVLIWFGDQCIFHFQRISDNRAGMDVYLQPQHTHVWLDSESPITSAKNGPQKTLRKHTRHANIESDKNAPQEPQNANEPNQQQSHSELSPDRQDG